MGVPEQCGEGKATVRISFPGLKTLLVAPTTAEVVIQKAPPEAQPTPVK